MNEGIRKRAAFLSSKIKLGVAGKDGFFDDIKVWNAEPAKH